MERSWPIVGTMTEPEPNYGGSLQLTLQWHAQRMRSIVNRGLALPWYLEKSSFPGINK